MDRRKLLFSFWFVLCLPNIQAQQTQTPVLAPHPEPFMEGLQTDLPDYVGLALRCTNGIVTENAADRHSGNVVAPTLTANLRKMPQHIRGGGLSEIPQQNAPLPNHFSAVSRTIVTLGRNMTAEQASKKLEITGPLSEVSLSSAIRRESVKGIPLKEPENSAQKTFAAVGVQYEHSFARQFRPKRNRHPIWYKPLYFEDPNLERCGRGGGIINEALSAVRFFGRVPALPVMLANDPPGSCVRALPDCPTCHKFGHDAYLKVPEPDGALLQIAAAVGLIFLIP